jgi:hypothetical protein
MEKTRPRTVRLTTSVSAKVAQKLEAIAHAQKVSKSWAMARALEAFVENPASAPKKTTSRSSRRNPSA